MIHLVLSRLATDPGLFVEHASAYAELLALEAGEVRLHWQRRVIVVSLCVLLAVLALTLTGVAAMLTASIPWQSMPAPWLLWGVPASLWLACAALGWFAASRPRAPPFPHLREQWAVDAQIIRDAAGA